MMDTMTPFDPQVYPRTFEAPLAGVHHPVVVFDGVCRLCNAWVRFLLRYDRQARYRLCPAQSETGQALLRRFGQPTDQYQSVLLVQGERVWLRSDAVLEILRGLPAPWCWLAALRMIPRPVRDAGYAFIARHRYRL
ncbi:MAG: DCC1-like thiol-disulfide oxidoreductase family protein, partial [Marinobacter sp.]|nr:DCC1-like thiol-disulfide oxidoreductase family protein [Marinobacter sp.]